MESLKIGQDIFLRSKKKSQLINFGEYARCHAELSTDPIYMQIQSLCGQVEPANYKQKGFIVHVSYPLL